MDVDTERLLLLSVRFDKSHPFFRGVGRAMVVAGGGALAGAGESHIRKIFGLKYKQSVSL
jgi:hypothetical protein